VGGRPAWHQLPCTAMLAYGWVFHMGFFNFYLSMGLCLWALAVVWDWQPRLVALAAALARIRYRERSGSRDFFVVQSPKRALWESHQHRRLVI
jgi:hypothetical protein